MKKRTNKIDWKQWISRSTNLLKNAIDIYIGIKRKEPLYVASGMMGAISTTTEWINSKSIDISQEMHSRGMSPLYTSTQITRFWNTIIREMKLPCQKITLGKERFTEYNALTYNLNDTEICFIWQGSWLEAIYGTDKKEAITALGRVVERQLGKYIALSTYTESWSIHASLCSMSTKFTQQLAGYISPIDAIEFIQNVDKFHTMGLNRATLLYGPPGTGKTTFAALLARETDKRLLVIESASLNKVMEAGLPLEELIDITQPGILLFDDLDRVSNPEELFGEIERLNRVGRTRGLLILGAINNLEALPEPLRRPGRFDEIIDFELPCTNLRKRILLSHLKDHGVRIANGYIHSLIEWTEGLSGAELRELALQISIRGFNEKDTHIRCQRMLKLKNIGKETTGTDSTPDKKVLEPCITEAHRTT